MFFVSVFCKLLHPAQNHSVAIESYNSPRKIQVCLSRFECQGDTLSYMAQSGRAVRSRQLDQ